MNADNPEAKAASSTTEMQVDPIQVSCRSSITFAYFGVIEMATMHFCFQSEKEPDETKKI